MAKNARQRKRAREDSAARTSNAMVRRQRTPRSITENGITTVRGSESIGQLGTSSSAAAYNAVPLNLFSTSTSGIYGLGSTWLGRQATLFNRFRIVSARLRYVPFVPTSTPGRIVMAFNGDTDDNAPTTVAQVTQYQNSVEAPLWREVACNMPTSAQREYVVSGGNYSGLPTAPGLFLVATDQATASTSVGSLYLDYTVQFWSRAAFSANT